MCDTGIPTVFLAILDIRETLESVLLFPLWEISGSLRKMLN